MNKIINQMKNIIALSLFAITFVYLLTGLGITEYRIIGPLTGGLLGKDLSFKIHLDLLIPFTVLLTVHILSRTIVRAYSILTGNKDLR